MKLYTKQILLFLFAFTGWFTSAAQQNSITRSAAETGNQVHAACKEVHLTPGYTYTATSGQSMHSYIDKYQVCDVAYVSGFSSGSGAPAALNTNLAVGTTNGSLAVSPVGGAAYTVQLIVSPGTNGMAPDLSINYNSLGGDGFLGMGWALSGLSSVSRTSHTIYHNGSVSPVDLTNNDDFTLDGNRLIVTSGTNGANGAVYGTESESFYRITSTGVAGAGPDHFTVETKDGSTLEYGNTADSRIEASGSTTVLTWLLNKVTDNNGNYMTITYTEDNANGEYRPDHIDYTGNANAGLTPYNQVKFVYGTRADKQVSYVAGHIIKQSVLLVALEMYAQGTKMHEYDLNYSYDMGSHLSELIEKGTDDKQYNSTKFSWESSYSIKPVENAISYFDDKDGDYVSADVNGDGFADAIKLSGNNWNLYQNDFLTTGSVSFSTPATNSSGILDANLVFAPDLPVFKYPKIIKHNATPCDLNGDGYDDLIVFIPPADGVNTLNITTGTGPAAFVFYLSDGSGLIKGDAQLINDDIIGDGISPDGITYLYIGNTIGDFDGDGTTDLFTYSPMGAKWRIYTFKTGTPVLLASGTNAYQWESTGYYAVSTMPADHEMPQLPDFYSFDMNADGKDEIALVGDGTRLWLTVNTGYKTFYVNELTSAGTLHEIVSDYYPVQKHENLPFQGYGSAVYPGDFNGDGNTDLLVWQDGTGWKLNYSTGTSFVAAAVTPALSDYVAGCFPPLYFPLGAGAEKKHELIVCDLNADGKTDILEKITDGISGTDMRTLYSKGNDAFEEDNTHFTNTYSKTAYLYASVSCIGDYNGDGHPDLLLRDGDLSRNSAYFTFLKDKDLHKVHKITNGLNFVTAIEYNTLPVLARQGKYTKGSAAVFPLNDFQRAFTAVSKITQDNGVGSTNDKSYYYTEALTHKQGKGFLGFTGMIVHDERSNIATKSTYDYPTSAGFFQLTLNRQKTALVNSSGIVITDINKKTYQYQVNALGGIRQYTYVNELTDEDLLHGNTTVYQFHRDAYGNTDEINSDNGVTTSTLSNTFEQKGAWLPSRLTETITSTTRTGSTDPAYVRYADYTNDASGRPVTVLNDGGNTSTAISYDDFGNILSIDVTGSDIATRSISNMYDPKGRFLTKQTNGLLQEQEAAYDGNYGNLISSKDLNSLETNYSYNAFGDLTKITTATGAEVNSTQTWDNTVSNGLYALETKMNGIPVSRMYLDILRRPIRSQTTGFDGTNINTDAFYDENGLLTGITEPYYEGSAVLNNTYAYDAFFRLQTASAASGASLTNSYSGNTITAVTTTGSGLSTKTSTMDAGGFLTSVTDEGGTLTYTYGNSGQPVTISIPGSSQLVTISYDNLGRQTSMSDPDAGPYAYTYNALGEIKTILNPNGNIHTYDYDGLGRVISNAGSMSEGTITYTYDNKPHGKGLIGTVTTTGNFTGNQEYTYDNYSRLQSVTEIIDGTNYTNSLQYDNLNRITGQTYPGSGFAVNYSYNPYGYLEKIKKAGDNSLIWQCNAMTEREQVASSLTGNNSLTSKTYSDLGFLEGINVKNSLNNTVWDQGYDFDPTNGNLKSRSDNLLSPDHHKEEFSYDNLDRLTQIKLDGVVSLNTSYTGSGNISSKSDVGTYDYLAPQPHAVTGITSPVSPFSYMQQMATYNEFKMAGTITEDIHEVNLYYGADHSRTKMVMKTSGATTGTRYYAGDYEKTVTATDTRELNYIHSTDGLCAIYAKNISGGIAKDTMYYVNSDHLGSISLISDASGNVVQEINYDAWGKRRAADTWSAPPAPVHYLFDRGYTGHEHLEQLHLINMNARLYDPVVGRMLNADDYVQTPDFTQSFNRYSYVINNPLKFIDPSGNFTDFYSEELALGDPTKGNKNNWHPAAKEQASDWRNGDPVDYDGRTGGDLLNHAGNNSHSGGPATTAASKPAPAPTPTAPALTSTTVFKAEDNGGGRNYGGDGSGSFMDNTMYVLDQVNQFNPIASGWDAISGYATGKDRLGNDMSTTEITLAAVGAIPFMTIEVRTARIAARETYVVYRGLDAAGNVKYIGITKREASVRFAEHLKSVGTGKELLRYRVIDGASGLTKTQARVIEQTLINQYGLEKNGGQLLNKINSIAPKDWWQYGIH